MSIHHGDGLEKWEVAVTKKLVGEFRRTFGTVWRQEFDDLVQDCLLHWIGVRTRLVPDPENPPVVYMAQVLRNKLTDLMRVQTARKRVGDLNALSLDALNESVQNEVLPVELADLGDLGEWLDPKETQGTAGIDARIDVGRAVARLSPFQRSLCLMLGQQGLSAMEAAVLLRISRGSVYEEIRRIRKVFECLGLALYMEGEGRQFAPGLRMSDQETQ